MMRFESISREGTAYDVIKSDSCFRDIGFNRSPGAFLAPEIREFRTFGDGMTQHSPASPVSTDHFVDALASLATHLQDSPADVETVAQWWPRFDHEQKIAFARTIKYNEEKPAYFSMEQEKVSRSDKLRNDRRYEPVPPWADGHIEATFGFVCHPWYGAVQRFALYEEVRKAYGWQNMEGSGIGSTEDYRYLADSFHAVDALVRAYHMQDYAKRAYRCLKNNWIDRQNVENVAAVA